jgi:hypothetical protein
MNKIRLELEMLAVDSFVTEAAEPGVGTVHARQAAATGSACLPETLLTCPRRQTNYASCVANCECTNGLYACLPRPEE